MYQIDKKVHKLKKDSNLKFRFLNCYREPMMVVDVYLDKVNNVRDKKFHPYIFILIIPLETQYAPWLSIYGVQVQI